MLRVKYSPELFVKLWLEGKTQREIRKLMGFPTTTAVRCYAVRLRKNGVKLPMTAFPFEVNPTSLNALVKAKWGG